MLSARKEAIDNYHRDTKNFIKGTIAENAPSFRFSSQKGINIGALVEALDQTIPEPVRDPGAEPVMLIARSFDVNKNPAATGKMSKEALSEGLLIRGILPRRYDIRKSGQAGRHRSKTG